MRRRHRPDLPRRATRTGRAPRRPGRRVVTSVMAYPRQHCMPLLPLLAHSTHPCHPTHQRRGTCSARSLGSAACTTSSLSAGSVRSHSQSSSSSPSPAVARLVTPKESALAASSLACRSRSVRPVPTASGCMAASCAVSSMESLFISARGDAQGDPYVWRGELRTHVRRDAGAPSLSVPGARRL